MREYDLDEILSEFEGGFTVEEDLLEEEPIVPSADETDPQEMNTAKEESEAVPDNATRIFQPLSASEEDGGESSNVSEPESEAEEASETDQIDKTSPNADVLNEKSLRKKPGKKKPKRKKKESIGARIAFALLSLIFMAVSLVGLAWSLLYIHPDTNTGSDSVRTAGTTNLVSRLDSGLNNSKATALSDITFIPKHYSIPESDTVAPKPQESKFGSVSPDNASAVMDIIRQAQESGLLEGQRVIFSPDLNFRSDTNIQYYYDETILTILWKEKIDGNTVTCCEVKVADPSQFRRKIVDDTFGSGNKLFATSLAASVNSVVAMNADFYMFRDFGIVVYDRELYRFSEADYTGNYKKYNCTDTLFVNDQGDFLFWHRLQQASPEEMRSYIAENNILFSIAFGPILVENGELTPCDWYPAGEIDRGYSRAGIAQADHLHYFYMSLNHSAEKEARWTVNQFGQRMYERGLRHAYCLDGGQTGEIVWRGAPFNYIDFGAEREVSDIIYFATAIPESEANL